MKVRIFGNNYKIIRLCVFLNNVIISICKRQGFDMLRIRI